MGFNKQPGEQLPAAELNSFYSSAGLYGASSAGSDSYAITVNPVPNDYDAGDTYTFKADVGNADSATLNVNGLGARTIKKFGSLDLGNGDIQAGQMVTVKYDGTYFQMSSEARPVPFFYQELPTTDRINSFVSNADGSILIAWFNQTLIRYRRDTLTGIYGETHRVATTPQNLPSVESSFNKGLALLGNYVYLFADGGANVAAYRYDLSTLANQTAMTFGTAVPATASGAPNPAAFVQNGYIYVANGGTFHKLSVSGTNFTTVSTVEPALALGNPSGGYLTDANGTLWQVNNYGLSLAKATAADAASAALTPLNMERTQLDNEGGYGSTGLVNIDASRMYLVSSNLRYVGNASSNAFRAFLIFKPISKP